MLTELLKNDGELSNQDLAALADWAGTKKYKAAHPEWKRAYALIREGADLLLRRRVRSENGNGVTEIEVESTTKGSL